MVSLHVGVGQGQCGHDGDQSHGEGGNERQHSKLFV